MSDKKIGALWKKTTQTGKTLLTGNIEVNGEKIKLAVFDNGYKQEGTRQPDYIIYEDTDQAPQTQSAPAPESDPVEDTESTPFRVIKANCNPPISALICSIAISSFSLSLMSLLF